MQKRSIHGHTPRGIILGQDDVALQGGLLLRSLLNRLFPKVCVVLASIQDRQKEEQRCIVSFDFEETACEYYSARFVIKAATEDESTIYLSWEMKRKSIVICKGNGTSADSKKAVKEIAILLGVPETRVDEVFKEF